jgi:hypothetical protein
VLDELSETYKVVQTVLEAFRVKLDVVEMVVVMQIFVGEVMVTAILNLVQLV